MYILNFLSILRGQKVSVVESFRRICVLQAWSTVSAANLEDWSMGQKKHRVMELTEPYSNSTTKLEVHWAIKRFPKDFIIPNDFTKIGKVRFPESTRATRWDWDLDFYNISWLGQSNWTKKRVIERKMLSIFSLLLLHNYVEDHLELFYVWTA